MLRSFGEAGRAPQYAGVALAVIGLLSLVRCAYGDFRNMVSPPRPNVLHLDVSEFLSYSPRS